MGGAPLQYPLRVKYKLEFSILHSNGMRLGTLRILLHSLVDSPYIPTREPAPRLVSLAVPDRGRPEPLLGS